VNYPRVNDRIRATEVRLIDDEGENLGVVSREQALELAAEKGLDLIEVAGGVQPPVCKLLDYGKYKYQQSKRDHEARRSQHVVNVKEIKFRPNTDEHDYQFKLNHIRDFLKDKAKVKVRMVFKGRQGAHPELGKDLLNRLAEDVAELGVVEQAPRKEGRFMFMMLNPK